jgi:hypothetical protein
MFRFYLLGNFVAGCLCGIGCVIFGGAIGVVGAVLSACWALLHVWVLKHVTRDAAKRPQEA